MAIRHGKAGQYGKSEAGKRFRRAFTVLLLSAAAVFVTLGFTAGYFWGSYGSLAASLALLILLGPLLYSLRFMDPYLDKLSKERIQHLKGAQIEALVA
jgi:hypothetical protein